MERKNTSSNRTILIRGTKIPADKQIKIGLTYIYGIGRTLALEICKKSSLLGSELTAALNPEQMLEVSNSLNEYTILGDLSNQRKNKVLDLVNIKCNRGMRHIKKFPVRGQSTRRNARSCKKSKKW